MAKAQKLLWDTPERFSNENAIPGVAGAVTPLCVAKGRWTNADVYIIAPVLWFTQVNSVFQGGNIPPGIFLILTSLEDGIETVVAQMTLSQASLQNDGSGTSVSGRVFSIRGQPTTGWKLYCVVPNPVGGAVFPPGIVRMECWGDDSGESRALGQSPFNPVNYLSGAQQAAGAPGIQEIDYPVQVPPLGLAVLMGNDATTKKLGIVAVSTAGGLSTTPTNIDGAGNEKVAEQFAPVYEDNVAGRALVEQRNAYNNITAATTTTVKAGSGFLHLIAINKPVASATITIFDSLTGSGTKIATITLPAALVDDVNELEYDVIFNTGLTIVTSAGTDLTVSYR